MKLIKGTKVKVRTGAFDFENRVGKISEYDKSDKTYCVIFKNDETIWLPESYLEKI